MRAGGVIITAALIGAGAVIAYLLSKASHDVANQITDWEDALAAAEAEGPTPELIALMRDYRASGISKVLPAGFNGSNPVNSFDDLRAVEGFYSVPAKHLNADRLTNTRPGFLQKQTTAAALRPILRASVNEAPGSGETSTVSKDGNAAFIHGRPNSHV